jgi:hypothetical protein
MVGGVGWGVAAHRITFLGRAARSCARAARHDACGEEGAAGGRGGVGFALRDAWEGCAEDGARAMAGQADEAGLRMGVPA